MKNNSKNINKNISKSSNLKNGNTNKQKIEKMTAKDSLKISNKSKSKNINASKNKNNKDCSVKVNNGKPIVDKKINKINFKINILIILLIVFIGISFARFTYHKISTNNSNLVAGDIYMNYTSNETKNISLIPKDTYDANDYFEFTISGKNQSNRDIYYDIVLKYGETKASPYIRIADDFVRFRLVKVVNGEEDVLFDNKSFTIFDNKTIHADTIPGNSDEIVNEVYRLYVWVNGVIVGNVPSATYTSEEWEKVYANVNVVVNGDFEPKGTDDSVKVNFDANGGYIKIPYKYYDVGSMYEELPTPVRDGYTFVGWLYNNNLVKSTDYVIEYGSSFVREEDFEFDGTNYIDTGVYLFNTDNASKNFYLSFTIEENTSTENQATIINSKLESESRGYPGFLFRKTSDNKYEISANVDRSKNIRLSKLSYNASKVDFVRIDNKLYYSLDDGGFDLVLDYTGFDNYFNVPLTIGASLKENMEPQRYFKGTLSHLILQFLDEEATLDNFLDHFVPRSTEGITLQAIWSREKYEYKGEIEFVGSNYIDTDVYLFNERNWERNFYMAFEIVEDTSTDKMATPMSAKYETAAPYQGFELRHNNSLTTYRSKALKSNANGDFKDITNIPVATNKKVQYLRINKVLYYSFDSNTFTKMLDFDGFTLYFDLPVTFGASLLNTNSPQRYFKGTLKDITVEFISDSATVQDYES